MRETYTRFAEVPPTHVSHFIRAAIDADDDDDEGDDGDSDQDNISDVIEHGNTFRIFLIVQNAGLESITNDSE